jgi:hypothetical protein
MLAILKEIIIRDLYKLKSEIELYRNEEKIWQVEKGINNSGGTLCVHLIGSLNHFIGAKLGDTGYVRDHAFEFSRAVLPRADLIKGIGDTIGVVARTLDSMTEAELEEDFPQMLFEKKVTTAYLLTHVVSHLNYHLGQVNYHRRLIDK